MGKLRAAEDKCFEMYGHCMEKSYTRNDAPDIKSTGYYQ